MSPERSLLGVILTNTKLGNKKHYWGGERKKNTKIWDKRDTFYLFIHNTLCRLFGVLLPLHITRAEFIIGVVCDSFLRYSYQDQQICAGAAWWAKWVNDNGGLEYPKKKKKKRD